MFTIIANPVGDSRIAVLVLATGEQRIVGPGTQARYSPTGHLVYAQNDTLWAVSFDVDRLEAHGAAVPVQEGVLTKNSGAADFDVSDNGSLMYVAATSDSDGRGFVWVDEQGGVEPLPLPARAYLDPRVSPDGGRIAAVVVDDDGGADLWVYEVLSGAGLPLTQGLSVRVLAWTPDGDRIIFGSNHDGPSDLYSVPTDGSGQPERLTSSDDGDFPTSVSPDGRVVAFTRLGQPESSREIWEVAVDGSGAAVPLLVGEFSRGNADYSPDGAWLIFRSDHSGEMDVYVQPYPGPGPIVPVSIGGGNDAIWASDGSRLFYRRGDQMMAVPIERGGSLQLGSPEVLFEGDYFSTGPNGVRQHHVAPDGRFLMLREESPNRRLVVVLNWTEELTQLIPAN